MKYFFFAMKVIAYLLPIIADSAAVVQLYFMLDVPCRERIERFFKNLFERIRWRKKYILI